MNPVEDTTPSPLPSPGKYCDPSPRPALKMYGSSFFGRMYQETVKKLSPRKEESPRKQEGECKPTPSQR